MITIALILSNYDIIKMIEDKAMLTTLETEAQMRKAMLIMIQPIAVFIIIVISILIHYYKKMERRTLIKFT